MKLTIAFYVLNSKNTKNDLKFFTDNFLLMTINVFKF